MWICAPLLWQLPVMCFVAVKCQWQSVGESPFGSVHWFWLDVTVLVCPGKPVIKTLGSKHAWPLSDHTLRLFHIRTLSLCASVGVSTWHVPLKSVQVTLTWCYRQLNHKAVMFCIHSVNKSHSETKTINASSEYRVLWKSVVEPGFLCFWTSVWKLYYVHIVYKEAACHLRQCCDLQQWHKQKC